MDIEKLISDNWSILFVITCLIFGILIKRIQNSKYTGHVIRQDIESRQFGYINVIQSEKDNYVSVILYVGNDEIMRIGDKMNTIIDQAYMNGNNWSAFFSYYFSQEYPQYNLLETDNEGDNYVVNFNYSDESIINADRIAGIMNNLLLEEEKIYKILEDSGEMIRWD